MIKKILTLIYFIFIFSEPIIADNKMFQQGEELQYEVSFLGIKLGSIKIISEKEDLLGKNSIYKAKCLLDSYSSIPFFSLHTKFESWFDQSSAFSYQFVGNSQFISSDWEYEKIIFNYDMNYFTDEKWKDKEREYIDTFYTKKRWSDGLSLFFLARQYIFSNKHIVVPTIMSRDTSPTYLHFIGKIEPIEIESVKYPIKTVYFTGRADWNGIYGLSGNFEGWFSADDARVPIKAKMKVYIGNVVVELKRWKRQNWSPPRID